MHVYYKYFIFLFFTLTFCHHSIFLSSVRASENSIDSLLQEVTKAANDSIKNELYNEIVKQSSHANRSDAMQYLHLKLGYNLRKKNTLEIFRTYSDIINNYILYLANLDSARYYTQKIHDLAKKENNAYYLSAYHFFSGTTSLYSGEYVDAMNSFYKSLEYIETDTSSERHLSLMAATYSNMAITIQTIAFRELGRNMLSDSQTNNILRQSMDYYYNINKIYGRLKNTNEQAIAHLNMGIAQYYFGEDDSALYYYEIALTYAEEIKNETTIAAIYQYISQVYQNYGESKKAIQYLNKAREIFEMKNEWIGLANVYSYLANVYRSENLMKLDSAEKYYLLAYDIFEKNQLNGGASGCLSGLHKVFNDKKDYKKALYYYKLHIEKENEILNEEKIKNISELQKKYETQKKEFKIIQLEKSKLLHEKRDKQFLAGIFGLTGILILCIGVIIIYRQKVINNQKKSIIAQQKLEARLREEELNTIQNILDNREQERRRIASELHDRLGVMLSTASLYTDLLSEESEGETRLKLKQLISDAAEETRKVAQELNSPVLQRLGLEAAVRELAEQVNHTGKIQLKYTLEDTPLIPQKFAAHLFRIIQELVNNTLRHAPQATQIQLSISCNPHQNIHFRYQDNGMGFDPIKFQNSNNTGYISIVSRINDMKGSFSLPELEQGMAIEIDIPLSNNQNT